MHARCQRVLHNEFSSHEKLKNGLELLNPDGVLLTCHGHLSSSELIPLVLPDYDQQHLASYNRAVIDAHEFDCRHISLQGIGSLGNGHFALEIDCGDMPELPSNWSREVSCRVVLVNKQSEKFICKYTAFAFAHGDLLASVR